MFRTKAWIGVLALISMITFAGCKDNASSPNPNDDSKNTFNPFSPTTGAGGEYIAWLSASVTDNDWFRYVDIARTSHITDTDYDFKDCAASFQRASGYYNPGLVAFNNHGLFSDSISFYRFDGNTFSMNGGSYVWEIGGSVAMPAFTDTIVAPSSKVQITSHSVYDSVSKSSSMIVTWYPNNNSDYTVVVILHGKDSNTPGVGFMARVDDTGSLTIPASTFSGLPDQKFVLSISRGVYKTGVLPNGEEYIMTMYSQHNVDLRLTN